MTAVMKREIKNYLKQPLFWLGLLLVAFGIFQSLEPYLSIHYISSEKELPQDIPEWIPDGDVGEGYVPLNEEERRNAWEQKMKESMISDFGRSREEAGNVITEMKSMEIGEACKYLEEEYHYYGAISLYQDVKYHRGTKEEINDYISGKLEERRFSYYFSRKFADFTGLFMGFAAAAMLALLFWQDTRKNTYELLHTKPVRGPAVCDWESGGRLSGLHGGACGFELFVLGALHDIDKGQWIRGKPHRLCVGDLHLHPAEYVDDRLCLYTDFTVVQKSAPGCATPYPPYGVLQYGRPECGRDLWLLRKTLCDHGTFSRAVL